MLLANDRGDGRRSFSGAWKRNRSHRRRIEAAVGRRTGTIDDSGGHADHSHKAIVEFRGDPCLDLPGNRIARGVGRCPDEYLLDLCRAAAQRIAQIRSQVVLQTEERRRSDENKCRAQKERVPRSQSKWERTMIHSSAACCPASASRTQYPTPRTV